jgi:hypothetical protein
MFTNRREFTGRDGKPIRFEDMTDERLDARLWMLLNVPLTDDEPASDPIVPAAVLPRQGQSEVLALPAPA